MRLPFKNDEVQVPGQPSPLTHDNASWDLGMSRCFRLTTRHFKVIRDKPRSMVTSERANKRRRLSTDPIDSVEASTRANNGPLEARSTGRSVRSKTGGKSGASGSSGNGPITPETRTSRRTPRSSKGMEGGYDAAATQAEASGSQVALPADQRPAGNLTSKANGKTAKSSEQAARRRGAFASDHSVPATSASTLRMPERSIS